MPSPVRAPAARARRLRLLLAAAGCTTLVTGCGAPPELTGPTTATPRRSVTAAASASASASAPAAATSAPVSAAPLPGASSPTTGFPDTTAVPCGGAPTADEVLRALRRAPGVLPDGVRLRVKDGPFCAGTWQYATVRVLRSPEPEPLQVVTRGRPRSLTVVTAGTDVCSIPVRAEAPAGIRTLACEAAPLPGTSSAPPP